MGEHDSGPEDLLGVFRVALAWSRAGNPPNRSIHASLKLRSSTMHLFSGNSAKTLEQATKSFDMSTGSQQQAAAPPLFSRERLSAYIDPGLLILVALKGMHYLCATRKNST